MCENPGCSLSDAYANNLYNRPCYLRFAFQYVLVLERAFRQLFKNSKWQRAGCEVPVAMNTRYNLHLATLGMAVLGCY